MLARLPGIIDVMWILILFLANLFFLLQNTLDFLFYLEFSDISRSYTLLGILLFCFLFMILETVPFQGRNSSSSILSNILTYSFLYSLTFSFFFIIYYYFSVGDWISNSNSITLLCFFLSFSFTLAPALTTSNFLRYDWTLLSKQSIKLFLMQWYFCCCNCSFVFIIFKFFYLLFHVYSFSGDVNYNYFSTFLSNYLPLFVRQYHGTQNGLNITNNIWGWPWMFALPASTFLPLLLQTD